jgi:VTC domain
VSAGVEAQSRPERDDVQDEPARSALAHVLASDLASRPAVSLRQVMSVASLTTRFDLKYLVPADALPDVLDCLPRQLAVLDFDGRQVCAYESVYFDTADLALYRHHVQGRRKRYKVRTRSYRDTCDALLEVKLKGWRGQTVKERLPYDASQTAVLTAQGRAFLESVIDETYGSTVPDLQAVLTTAYRRTTLVDLEHQSRVTIDVDLGWSDQCTGHRADRLAMIESKSLSGPGPVDAVMSSLGLRPVRLSKYCIGVALLHPDIAANPWSHLLRRHFGWQRTDPSG